MRKIVVGVALLVGLFVSFGLGFYINAQLKSASATTDCSKWTRPGVGGFVGIGAPPECRAEARSARNQYELEQRIQRLERDQESSRFGFP